LAWPSAKRLSSGMEAAFGSNPNPEKDQPSDSPSRIHEMADNSLILVVEDNLADVFLIREAIKASGVNAKVHVVNNGEDAIRFFDSADRDDSSPLPGLVILDINLPKVRGKEVLERLRQSRRCRDASVIVASTSDTLQDRKIAAATGTNIYFRKPSEYDEFMKLGLLIRDFFPQG